MGKRIKKTLFWIKKQYGCIVFGMIFIYVLLFTFLVFSWHDGLKSQMNDLGNMDQPIYNSTKGHFMIGSNSTMVENPKINRLGGHANFILVFFVPIYYFLADPKVLLFTETLVIGLGALPIYWFGRHLFGEKSLLAILGPFVYLINPMVHDVNLFDFHSLAVAMPLILFAFYFMYTKKYFWFYLFAILIVLTQEEMSLIVFMLGIYMIFVQKEIKRGLVVSLTSLMYFFATVEMIMPYFANGEKSSLVAARYAHLGGSVSKIISNLILHPWFVTTNLFSYSKITYIIILLTPVLFVPVLTLEILLISLPTIFINLLSLASMMYYPFQYYHMAPILAFIFLAYVKSIHRLFVWNRNWLFYKTKYLISASIVSSVVFSALLSPAPYSAVSSWKEFQVSSHAKNINKVRSYIPDSASLSVQNNLGAHFSKRLFIYTFPLRASVVDYVLIDVNDPNQITRQFPRRRDFGFSISLDLGRYRNEIIKLFNNKDFGVVYFSRDGYILFQRNAKVRKNTEALRMFNVNMAKIFDRNTHF